MKRLLPVLATLALPSLANAQAYQCRMPQNISVPKIKPEGRARLMPVTGYTMALSWSPEFCKPREGQRAHATQCSGKNGRFGLVVHGFWPDGRGVGRGSGKSNSRASWPQWCPAKRPLNRAELKRNLCMMPSAKLIARQWAKHGACMGLPPETYFKITRILWSSYQIPDYDRLSREKGLTAGDIRGAFASANGGIERQHIGVKLNGRGWLQELRICYNKRFRPTPCDSRRFGSADGDAAKIWRGL